jgi:hypothetical protein
MAKMKVCGCYYNDINGKRHHGLYIHNCETNTFTIINKKLEKVTNATGLVTCENSMGNIFINVI